MTEPSEVVKTESQLPAASYDYGTDAGAGVETIGRDEAGIPFLKILQAQSPEVAGSESEQIDGAKAGVFLNTGNEQISDTVAIVPAVRQHVFVEWRARNQGGGIVAVYEKNDPVVLAAQAENAAAIEAGEPSRKPGGGTRRFGELYTEAGNSLVETFYVFAVTIDEDENPTGMVVVPFSSSQIKKYKKKFANRVRNCLIPGTNQIPPMFAHRIVLSTETEKNDEGAWKGYVIRFAKDNNVLQSLIAPDHPAFQAAKQLKAMVEGGEAKADLNKAGDAATDGGDDADDSAF